MEQILSSGNPFLDKILNDGFQLGSIILLIEDSPTKIYHSFIKYDIAEGVVNDNKIFFYYNNKQILNDIINNLPYQSIQVENILNSKSKIENTNDNGMKIAWRYDNINYTNLIGDISKKIKYIFDLSRNLQENFTKRNLIETKEINNSDYLEFLKTFISDYQNYAEKFTDEDKNKYCRIIIPNLFQYIQESEIKMNEIEIFLNILKNISRSINGHILITINRQIVNSKIIKNLEYFSDYVISIRSLLMVENKNKVGNYDGILYIEKRPMINSLKPIDIETDMFGILKDKRKIIIEKVDIGVEIDRYTKVKESDLKDGDKNQKYDF